MLMTRVVCCILFIAVILVADDILADRHGNFVCAAGRCDAHGAGVPAMWSCRIDNDEGN